MTILFRVRGLLIAVLFGLSTLQNPMTVFGQSKETTKTDTKPVLEQAIPLAVVCVAGMERWLNNMDYLFSTVKREELSDFVGGQMSKANDFKGFDRDKPAGMLIFLRPGLIPQPYAVTFVPVKNLSDAIGTLSTGPVKVKKIDETYYDIVVDNNTMHAKLAGDYVWLAQEADQLDYEFPNPAQLAERLSKRYDAAIEFNLTQVPEGMKNIFLDFLRASTETSMQQRDGEPDAGYQLRKVNALNSLDWIEQLLLQGERLTIGMSVNQETKQATIEADVVAKQDSAFAKSLQDVSARPSYFGNVLKDDVPMTFAMSWMMTPQNQKRLADFFETAEQDAALQLANVVEGSKVKESSAVSQPAPETQKSTGLPKSKRGTTGNKVKKPKLPVPPSIRDVFDSLRATARSGHVDFFVQFIADSKSNGAPQFTMIGGGKVADGTKLSGGLTEILRQIKGRPELADLEFNIDSHNGVTFHRLRGSEIRRPDELMYGAKPSLYLGLSSQAVWFAIGQPDSLTQLKQLIDRVQAEPTERPDRRDYIPFQFATHMKKWIEFGEANGEELQREALQAREKAMAAQRAAAEAAGAKVPDAKPTPVTTNTETTKVEVQVGGRGIQSNVERSNRPNDPNRRSPQQAWQEMQKKAFSGGDDQLRIDFKPTDQGARLRLVFDEGFIRLMGFGVSTGLDQLAEQQKRRDERQKKDRLTPGVK